LIFILEVACSNDVFLTDACIRYFISALIAVLKITTFNNVVLLVLIG